MSESLQSKVTLFHSSASGGPRQILFFCPFIVRNFDCEFAASIRSAPHRNYWFASRRCLCYDESRMSALTFMVGVLAVFAATTATLCTASEQCAICGSCKDRNWHAV